MRFILPVLMLALALFCGCDGSGCQRPTRSFIYKLATMAVEASEDWPADAKTLPIDEARIGLGKNAASVDVPYVYRDPATGAEKKAWMTVWFRRVARTWTVSRIHPAPEYGAADAAEEPPTSP